MLSKILTYGFGNQEYQRKCSPGGKILLQMCEKKQRKNFNKILKVSNIDHKHSPEEYLYILRSISIVLVSLQGC